MIVVSNATRVTATNRVKNRLNRFMFFPLIREWDKMPSVPLSDTTRK
jgi:hypothetical protein